MEDPRGRKDHVPEPEYGCEGVIELDRSFSPRPQERIGQAVGREVRGRKRVEDAGRPALAAVDQAAWHAQSFEVLQGVRDLLVHRALRVLVLALDGDGPLIVLANDEHIDSPVLADDGLPERDLSV